MTPEAWHGLLRAWSDEILDSPNALPELPPDVVAARWLGRPGATEEQIAAAEQRLDLTLPPSYRAFLRYTNGWGPFGPFATNPGPLLPVEDVNWFRTREAEWFQVWVPVMGETDAVSPEEHRVYGPEQDTAVFRSSYLRDALQVSETGDGVVLLLNPAVAGARGECEAWVFSNWYPGAYRYPSFWDLMQGQHEDYLRSTRSGRQKG